VAAAGPICPSIVNWLSGGFSPGTVAAIAQLCAMLAFGNARRLFAEFHEWAPSPRATLRMVDAVGAEARGFLDAAAVPDNDGDVLVIQVDGRGAPRITATEAERRRKPRRKRCGTKRHARRRRRPAFPDGPCVTPGSAKHDTGNLVADDLRALHRAARVISNHPDRYRPNRAARLTSRFSNGRARRAIATPTPSTSSNPLEKHRAPRSRLRRERFIELMIV